MNTKLLSAKQRTKIKREAEGFCTYEAHYPSGKYIGSGWTTARRALHFYGLTRIGKELEEKAYRFDIFLKANKEQCRAAEGELLRFVGLKNVLNKAYMNPLLVWWRHCSSCDMFLDKTMFYKSNRGAAKLRSVCVICSSARDRRVL